MALAVQTAADAAHRLRLAQPGQEDSIAVLLERVPDGAAPPGAPTIESVVVFPEDTISELKLRLTRSKRWFKSDATLVRLTGVPGRPASGSG